MRYLLFSFMMLLTISCLDHRQQPSHTTVDTNSKAKILVYFFHGTHRCTGCLNAEKATVAVLNDLYKREQEEGIVKFQSINFEEEKCKALVQKYQIAWNMLLIIPANDEKNRVDLTEKAFSFGTNSEGLKPFIKAAIEPMLRSPL